METQHSLSRHSVAELHPLFVAAASVLMRKTRKNGVFFNILKEKIKSNEEICFHQ